MYIVIMNQPGYLPESEPIECDTFPEAREAILAWIRADQIAAMGGLDELTTATEQECKDAYAEAAQWADTIPVHEITVGAWVYSIMRATM